MIASVAARRTSEIQTSEHYPVHFFPTTNRKYSPQRRSLSWELPENVRAKIE